MHDHHDDDLTRRTFLKALGASVALAGLDGCTRIPAEKILTFVVQPTEFTPGIPVHYATSMMLDGYATGLVVEANDGRPTKIEGNPDHPASLGAAGILEQASLLQLYDPDRAKFVRSGTSASTWSDFTHAMAPATLRQRVGARGAGLALLLEPTSSPLVGDTLSSLQRLYPDMRVHYYAPLSPAAASAAFTEAAVIPQYDVHAADVILSVGADFLASGPFHLRYAREFADRRRAPLAGMNRLYVAETGFTVTGATADHRLRCRPTEIEPFLESILATLATPSPSPSASASSSEGWTVALASDLRAHSGASLVIAGDHLSPRAHALVASINMELGNTGHTVWYVQSPLLGAGQPGMTLPPLVAAMRSGAVDTLVCIGGNPSYMTPRAVGFSEVMRRVPNSVYVGLHENETARDARWFVPAAHYLESWGDARAYDGTYSIVQPLVQPLHNGKSAVEVLLAMTGVPAGDSLAMLRSTAARIGVASDDASWSAALRQGFVAGTASSRIAATPRPDLLARAVPPTNRAAGSVDVVFTPGACVHDGSFANNGWLQELPDPVTKLTWDNAALISPGTARRLGLDTGDPLLLRHASETLTIPALIVPGHPNDVVTLHFGYGRTGAERVAEDVGTNVYRFWPAMDEFVINGVSAERAAGVAHTDFAITQTHWTMDGRDQARSDTLGNYRASQRNEKTLQRTPLTIYDPQRRLESPVQWAMTIDLGTCIGCSACVVACQSENNIPVVGRDDVAKSREMHWLRIDRYLEGNEDNPQVITQPMLCQHCENAPCEYVCPVGATVHSSDGLNEMVYNRCVGTRFCSNNCPYKVRRFNWFDYTDEISETERMARNPDVTVRGRGVMEKCTFCVQRIREAEINAGTAGRMFRGTDVTTACQQSCPTNAITFGSLTEPDSVVMRRREESRLYDVLAELGTEPRVRYLARIRNPNPDLESG